MKAIGTEIIRREVVHVKPGMYMVEYVATTYSCPVCKDTECLQFIKDDAAPKALIEGSYAFASLAAWAFYQKFAMSVPFYRLEKSFKEPGAKISRTTMANWAVQCNSKYFEADDGLLSSQTAGKTVHHDGRNSDPGAQRT